MRKFVIWFSLMIFSLMANAQIGRNYIYLLDCTKSMVGYNGTPNIWEPTKSYLLKDLERLDETCSWYIVPFNNNILNVYSSDNGRDALKEWNNSIEKECDELVQKVTNTNICDTWIKGLSLCDNNKYNYVYLLTDGVDNMPGGGVEKLTELMRQFCGTSKNTHVYYVMLTQNAKNEDVMSVAELCENIHVVDASNGPVNPFCLLEQTSININALELNKTKSLGFGLLGDYKASIKNDDEYFDVKIKDNVISNNKIELIFAKKNNIDEENYQFDVELLVEGVDILNNPITIKVTNRPERNIDIKGELNMGEASYVEPFLFFDGQSCDTLFTDLSVVYNSHAQKNGSKVVMQLVSNDVEKVDYEVFFNGKKCDNEIIELLPQKNNLGIVFKPGALEGERLFFLKLIETENLDKINDNHLTKYKKNDLDNDLQLYAEYNVDWHWAKTFLLWLGIIVLILSILWLFILRPIFVKKFRVGHVMITNPYYKYLDIHKAIKVVCTNNLNAKQNILSRIFLGKIIYEKNQAWIDEIELNPTMKGGCKLNVKGKYVVFPFASQLVVGEEYELENNITNEKIKITIN